MNHSEWEHKISVARVYANFTLLRVKIDFSMKGPQATEIFCVTSSAMLPHFCVHFFALRKPLHNELLQCVWHLSALVGQIGADLLPAMFELNLENTA